MRLEIPNNWNPRPYQMPAWNALTSGIRRAALVWHRRAGKDTTAENWTSYDAMQNIGLYWHMAPTLNQVRKIVWNSVNPDGKKVLEQVFPDEIVKKRHEQDMRTELVNGSVHQCVGSDNFNSLVGSNPRGVVFSEYSLSNPAAWDYIRPILAENGGWAIFPYTPRGANHGKTLYDIAQRSDDWFCQLLTVEDTGVITQKDIQAERDQGMSEEMIQQEFYCSFLGVVDGSYYGQLMTEAREEGRITAVPYDSSELVYTAWDIGYGDATAIWFFQIYGLEFRFIDYFESSGKKLSYYAQQLDRKSYYYGGHILPHDASKMLLATGKSIATQLQSYGFKNIITLPREQRLADELGIQEVRNTIPMAVFDESKCKRGIECLENYKKKWDETRKIFLKKPEHDWSSHGADAFRYFAMGRQKVLDDVRDEYEEDEWDMPQTDGWLA